MHHRSPRRHAVVLAILIPLLIALLSSFSPAEGVALHQAGRYIPDDDTATALAAATGTAAAATGTAGTPASSGTPGTPSGGTPGTAAPTATQGPILRATITPTPTPTNPALAATELIQNGGFETGKATPWIEFSTGNYELVSANKPHTGTYGAWLCGQPNCDDRIYQNVTLPPSFASIKFSFWIFIDAADKTSCSYTLTAQINLGDGTPLTTPTTLCNKDATNPEGWQQVVVDESGELRSFAGKQVQVYFEAKGTGSSVASFFVDDVSLAAVVISPTNTPVPTDTPTVPPTATATSTPTTTPTPLPSIQITGLQLYKSAKGVITDTCDVVLATRAPLKATTLLYPNQTGILRVLYTASNASSNLPQGQVVYQEKGKAIDGDFLLSGQDATGPFLCVAVSFTGSGVHHYDARVSVQLGPTAAKADMFFTVGKCAHGVTGSKGQCLKCAKGYKLKSGKCQKVVVKKKVRTALQPALPSRQSLLLGAPGPRNRESTFATQRTGRMPSLSRTPA